MNKIETSRKIAVLLHNTHFEISIEDICAYLNAQSNFFKQTENTTYDEKYLIKASGLPKKIVKKIEKAEKVLFELRDGTKEYTLAEEFAMISNAIGEMEDWYGFVEANLDLYKEAVDYFNKLGFKILDECREKYADEMSDLITDGTFTEENGNEAIYRYMIKNGFHNNSDDETEAEKEETKVILNMLNDLAKKEAE